MTLEPKQPKKPSDRRLRVSSVSHLVQRALNHQAIQVAMVCAMAGVPDRPRAALAMQYGLTTFAPSIQSQDAEEVQATPQDRARFATKLATLLRDIIELDLVDRQLGEEFMNFIEGNS